jgi:hypothetical protein
MVDLFQSVGPVLSEAERDETLNCADATLSEVEKLFPPAQVVVSEIESLHDATTVEAVQASCDDCPGTPFFFLPSSAITIGGGFSVVAELATAFATASTTETDPGLKARYADIATRLRRLPPSRVQLLTHPSSRAVGTYLVALRPDDVADDGHSPLAVVISAETGPGVMNFVDAHIVRDTWRAFVRTLEPDTALADDEDDDNDGVRDSHETETGRTSSRTDTGTDPVLADTDGDFFWDGTETNTGSDPNNPDVQPETAPPLQVPALGPARAYFCALLARLWPQACR